jgi:aminoglycoside phosphotransferase (APT) family kinase protein
MTASQADNQFEQVAHKVVPESRLLRTWKLHGGYSAQVTALEIARPDSATQKLVVRQHHEMVLAQYPQMAAYEFRLLGLLHAAGLTVPRPYHLGHAGEIFATPYLVLEYIEGETQFAPLDMADFLRQFAAHLSRIHQLDAAHLDMSFLPQQEARYREKVRARPAELDESLDEGRIREALKAVWPVPQGNRSVLLHGDYWPGNLLWKDGQLVGIIDWEDAEVGDPLEDVANSRLELLWAFGKDAMQQFTEQYQALNPLDFSNLPYWELWAALRAAFQLGDWAADASAEAKMRAAHHWFVAQAFEKLSAREK